MFQRYKNAVCYRKSTIGQPWGGKDAPEGDEEAVKAEVLKGTSGRFPAGAPSSGDMQLLFIQSAINKMDDECGRAAIIENGSPLFSGSTSSGESQIRRWLLENDYIEAIIQLSTDMFYNTGIATYIWVLSKIKEQKEKAKYSLLMHHIFVTNLEKISVIKNVKSHQRTESLLQSYMQTLKKMSIARFMIIQNLFIVNMRLCNHFKEAMQLQKIE